MVTMFRQGHIIVKSHLQGSGSKMSTMLMVFGQIFNHAQEGVPFDHGRFIKVFSYCQHQGERSTEPAGAAPIREERAVFDFLPINLQIDLHCFPTRTGDLGGRGRLGQSPEFNFF
jgi:hypothetical protein